MIRQGRKRTHRASSTRATCGSGNETLTNLPEMLLRYAMMNVVVKSQEVANVKRAMDRRARMLLIMSRLFEDRSRTGVADVACAASCLCVWP